MAKTTIYKDYHYATVLLTEDHCKLVGWSPEDNDLVEIPDELIAKYESTYEQVRNLEQELERYYIEARKLNYQAKAY